LIELVEAAGKQDEDIAVKYASSLKGWHNVVKNYQGQLDGFARIGASERKHAEEQAVLEWLRSQGEAGKAALDAHAKLVAPQAVESATRDRDLVFGQLRRTGAIGAASRPYRLAPEKQKPDAERGAGSQHRDRPCSSGCARRARPARPRSTRTPNWSRCRKWRAPRATATWCSGSCAAPARSAPPAACTGWRWRSRSPTPSASPVTSSATCLRSRAR